MINWNYDNFMLISFQSEQSLDVTKQKALCAVYSGFWGTEGNFDGND